jgi:hypothetical protein
VAKDPELTDQWGGTSSGTEPNANCGRPMRDYEATPRTTSIPVPGIAWSVKQSADLKEVAAHKTVDDGKRAQRERDPVWWKDGSPVNRHTAKNTPYSLGTQRSGETAPEEFECRKPRFSTSTVRY